MKQQSKRVLLVSPPFYRLMGSHYNGLSLGLAYIASVLLKSGHDVKIYNADYVDDATGYSPAPTPDGKDYLNYSVVIAADTLPDRDGDIQKIAVIVKRSDETVITLEGYKVHR